MSARAFLIFKGFISRFFGASKVFGGRLADSEQSKPDAVAIMKDCVVLFLNDKGFRAKKAF
jgi:hypothetical protein